MTVPLTLQTNYTMFTLKVDLHSESNKLHIYLYVIARST